MCESRSAYRPVQKSYTVIGFGALNYTIPQGSPSRMAPRLGETAIFCARTKALVYVVYLNPRRKKDATAHLRVAYHLNAGDANATYKLYFGNTGMMTPNIYFHERRPAEGELRALSDLRAQRGQARVVPYEDTTKRPSGAVAVKVTNQTARRKEMFNQTNLGKRKAFRDLGFQKNGVLIADEFSNGRSKVASQCSYHVPHAEGLILSQYNGWFISGSINVHFS